MIIHFVLIYEVDWLVPHRLLLNILRATPAHSRSREVLYSTITQADFYEKQEGKQITKLD